MIKGKTTSGFKFEYDEEKMDDMEFIELAARAETNLYELPKVMEWVLGEEQKKRLYDHVRETKGRASLMDTQKEFEEITEAAGESLKNLWTLPE